LSDGVTSILFVYLTSKTATQA